MMWLDCDDDLGEEGGGGGVGGRGVSDEDWEETFASIGEIFRGGKKEEGKEL